MIRYAVLDNETMRSTLSGGLGIWDGTNPAARLGVTTAFRMGRHLDLTFGHDAVFDLVRGTVSIVGSLGFGIRF